MALAEKDGPDPWLVADLPCYRGEQDAAEAFAKAALRADTRKLPAYVAAWRESKPGGDERALFEAMNAASIAMRRDDVLQANRDGIRRADAIPLAKASEIGSSHEGVAGFDRAIFSNRCVSFRPPA